MRNEYLNDVRPAIHARKRQPGSDDISHLLDKGYRPLEILVECVTYGAASMATTREFICMAAWHLLEDQELRQTYLGSAEADRHAILHEILRLEPVIGRLHRRTTEPMNLFDDEVEIEVPTGALLALDIGATNADAAAVGDEPLNLCPHRQLATGVQPPVLSFGDGPHRCPGPFIAIQESDIFLQRLLALPVVIEEAPTVKWNVLTEGYELREFELRLVHWGGTGVAPPTPRASSSPLLPEGGSLRLVVDQHQSYVVMRFGHSRVTGIEADIDVIDSRQAQSVERPSREILPVRRLIHL